jgi:hypothetical protein
VLDREAVCSRLIVVRDGATRSVTAARVAGVVTEAVAVVLDAIVGVDGVVGVLEIDDVTVSALVRVVADARLETETRPELLAIAGLRSAREATSTVRLTDRAGTAAR